MNKILITGVSSGIGHYLANQLKLTNEIIGISRQNNDINGIEFHSGDINNYDFLKNISIKIKKIDYLILNAGVGFFDKFENITLENHIKTINTNLTSNIVLTYELLNKINKGIIFIGSLSGKKSQKFGSVYSASKFGLRGFAMNLKNEVSGIKIHIVNPKIVKTNFHKNSQIEIVGKYNETSLQEIYDCVNNIIIGKETKFEIDL